MICSSVCPSAWSSWCSVFSSSACSSSSALSSLGWWLFSVGLSAQGCAKAPLGAAAAAWLRHLSCHSQPTSSNPAERSELQPRHKRRIAATHLVAAPPLQSCEPGPYSRTHKQRRCGGAASRVRGRRPLQVALSRSTALCGGRGRYIRVSVAPPGPPPRTLGLWRNSRRLDGCREPELVWSGRECRTCLPWPLRAAISVRIASRSCACMALCMSPPYGNSSPAESDSSPDPDPDASSCQQHPLSSEIENGKRAGKRNKPRLRPAPPHARARSHHLPPDPPAAPPPHSLR